MSPVSEAKEEIRGGVKGVAVADDDLAQAWITADEFAVLPGKRVIQDAVPQVFRRHEQVHWFFPYDPPVRG